MSAQSKIQQIDAGPRKSPMLFVISEFFIYLSQFFVFFLAAGIVSGLFRDEKSLLAYVNTKVTPDSQFDLWVTVTALAVVLGVLFSISSALSGKAQGFASSIAREVLQEFPRLLYAVGSSISGLAAAMGCFVALNPATEAPRPGWWIGVAVFIGLIFFMIGAGASYGLKHKTHISNDSNRSD